MTEPEPVTPAHRPDPASDLDAESFRHEMRQFFAGVVLYSQAVADQLGLSATELHCLNLMNLSPDLSPSQIGHRMGLTSGAVTRLVDRLEAAGYVHREPDPRDRRRVVVRRCGPPRDIRPLFAPMGRRMGAILSRMSETERRTVLDFVRRCNQDFLPASEELRHGNPDKG